MTLVPDPVILRVLERRVMYELGNDIECGKCKVTLYSGNNSRSHIFFQYMTFANEKCTYSMLLQRIRQIVVKKEIYIQFRYGKQSATHIVLILIVQNDKHNINFNRVLAESAYSVCKFTSGIDTSILQYCPSIMVSNDEVLYLNLTYMSGTLLHHPNDSMSVSQKKVCIDSYFASKGATSSAMAVLAVCCSYLNSIILVSVSLKYAVQF